LKGEIESHTFLLQSSYLFFKVFKKPVQRRKEEVYLKEGIRSQITLGLTGCNGAQQNWQSGLKPLLGYYLINLLLELIEQSNCILDKWFHTFWKELQCVSMAEIVAESKILLQVIQQ
jgi:hypothetical protein